MWAWIFQAIFKGLFMGLDQVMKKEAQDSDFYKSYINFLGQANKKGLVKVANLQAGEDALEILMKRTEDRSKKTDEG